MNNNYLIGLRTTKLDVQTLTLFLYYKNAGIDTVLVVDELKKEIECGIFPKVSLNKDTLLSLGLYTEHEKLGWLCGDFGLYLMALQYPNYKGYWLIEDDAFIASENLSTYLGQPLLKNIDFCAKSFWNAHNGWPWKESAEEYFQVSTAKKCLFSIIYVSKNFILDAFQKRVEYIDFFSKNQLSVFLNDESFLANCSKHYNSLKLDEIYEKEDLKNFHFTTSNNLFLIPPAFTNTTQGFYHPIVISNNSQDCNNRMIHILKKQKRLGRYYKNLMLNQVNENLKAIQKDFTPRVLVCIIYSGSNNIFPLGKSIKARWANYVVINLTENELEIESIPIYQVNDIASGLELIEKDHPNYDGTWIITDQCYISLDAKQSLVKQLEIPEKETLPFGFFKIGSLLNSTSIYYINFDYYKINGFSSNQALNMNSIYNTDTFFLSLFKSENNF